MHNHSEMAESEADTTETASVSPDGLQHSASGKGPYYYLVVCSRDAATICASELQSMTYGLQICLVA